MGGRGTTWVPPGKGSKRVIYANLWFNRGAILYSPGGRKSIPERKSSQRSASFPAIRRNGAGKKRSGFAGGRALNREGARRVRRRKERVK